MIEYTFNKNDFLILRKIVLIKTGIILRENTLNVIYARLKKRLRALNIKDLTAYSNLISQSIEEEIFFINLVTNNTTSFFRGSEQFDYIKEKYLNDFFLNNHKIRIWSASCSSGEEPYSIAIIIDEVLKNSTNYDIKILATDINTEALETAKRGIYSRSKIMHLSIERQLNYFDQYDINNHEVILKKKIKSLIYFARLNLLDLWPMSKKFNIVFIRNTLMFIENNDQKLILKKIDHLLELGGLIVLGYSEQFYNINNAYIQVGDAIYKKMK